MKLVVIVFFLTSALFYSQKSELQTTGSIDTVDISVLTKSPLKASLYSAIMPGLGQAYNKQYWKIPIVWGALGTSAGFIFYYNKRYRNYRDGFIASLNGDPTGYPDDYTTEILARAQDDMRRNRDYAIIITTLLYALNVLDAVVSAHLSEMKNDKDLAIAPTLIPNPMQRNAHVGLGVQFSF